MPTFSKCVCAGCDAPPAYRYSFPGKDERAICAVHGADLAVEFQREGEHLHLIPLHDHEIETPGDSPTTQEGDGDDEVPEGDTAG